jgi:hypothetical protein
VKLLAGLFLVLSSLVCQAQDATRILGVAPNGKNTFISTSVNGWLLTAGAASTGAQYTDNQYYPITRPTGLDPTGKFQFFHVDANGNLLTSNQATSSIPSGAIADYNFLDGTGTTLTDSSGNSNNGTLGTGGNAPTWVAKQGLFYPNGAYVSLPASLNGLQTIFLSGTRFFSCSTI